MSVRRIAIVSLLASFGCVGASSSSSGGGGGGGGSTESACDQYFDAYLASYACTLALPQSEATRQRPLFDEACADEVALPGSSLTSAFLTACAKAVLADPCGEYDPAECNAPAGTLAVGATCVDSLQCASGACTISASTGDDGGSTDSSCGTCTATVAVGGVCDPSNPQCGAGTDCTTDSNGSSTCVALTYGGAGDACDVGATACNPGLECDPTTMVCTTLGAAGAACEISRDCASGLVCANQLCAVGAALGAPCGTTTACATGLTCDPTTGACAAMQWAEDGDACSGSMPCLVGVCDFEGSSSTGICPYVAANGQPCPTDSTSTCDAFSECIDGVCAFPNSLSCK